MLGQAFENSLEGREIIKVGTSQWDLTRYDDALAMFETIRPTACIHLAARVGGVKANTDNMADFCTDNLSRKNFLVEVQKYFYSFRAISAAPTIPASPF